ncbi:transcriptional regulator [Sphingomonas citricola]|uniref:transcriptional regulator n=1 Tax=Sphingomonas citricola TaxID=2862498 RepID=UPI001C670F0E
MHSPKVIDGYEALLKAISAAGSQGKLASICGCTSGNIWQLVRRRSALPPRYVLRVEQATGISRQLLRSDLYPAANFDVDDHRG